MDSNGQPIAGARIKHQYDLIERGLAWHQDIDKTPEFFELSKEIRQRFAEL